MTETSEAVPRPAVAETERQSVGPDLSTRGIVVVAAVALVLASASALAWFGSDSEVERLATVLSILFSWPVVVGSVVMMLAVQFRKEFANLIERAELDELKSPFFTMTGLRQSDRSGVLESGVPTSGLTLQSPDAAHDIGTTSSPDASSNQSDSGSMSATNGNLELTTEVAHWKQRSAYWWLRFLSCYLVPNSKRVLLWFSQNPGSTLNAFHLNWSPLIQSIEERNAIIVALIEQQLVRQNLVSGGFDVTEYGTQFLQWVQNTEPVVLLPPIGYQ